VIEPNVAAIFAGPSDIPVSNPVVGPIVTTPCALEVQIAMLVTSARVPSEYTPVAVSCWEMPTPATPGFGLIKSPFSVCGWPPELLELLEPELSFEEPLLVPDDDELAELAPLLDDPLDPLVDELEPPLADPPVDAGELSRLPPQALRIAASTTRTIKRGLIFRPAEKRAAVRVGGVA
jgi:hypothetical protein